MKKYGLKDGFKELIKIIVEQEKLKDGMLNVFFAGGSASGKSTGAENIMKRLRELGYDVALISADTYSRGGRYAKENGISFDDPEYIDVEAARRDIENLENRKSIFEKEFNFDDEPFHSTDEKISPPKILLVEGLFVLRDELRDLADIKVFFNIGFHGWMLRRAFRDAVRTGMMPADIIGYCINYVEPKYQQWIHSTIAYADIVIENEYDPAIESKNSGRFEMQQKYSSSLDEAELIHNLLKLGADRLASVYQADIYFNPYDRNLGLTDEIVRIRKEGKRTVWTYKGPKTDGRRHKYEFEIPEDMVEAFLQIYGKIVKNIDKTRTIFLLGSIVVTVDSVIGIESGIKRDLGTFIEFRINTKTIGREAFLKTIGGLAKNIGLEAASVVDASYFEM